MKQLHIVQSIAKDFGGLGTAALQYSYIAATNGAEVKLFVLDGSKLDLVMDCSCANLKIVSPYRGGFVSMLWSLKSQIFRNEYHIIHIHGTWTLGLAIASKLAAIRGIKVAISPHGCLEPWALAHKKWKKKLALFLYQKKVFRSAKLINCSCFCHDNS
jgi:glycosyltransferase involved in cell wall biosynthesis